MLKITARILPLLLGIPALLTACRAGDPPPATARPVLVQAAAPAPSGTGIYTGEVRARHEVDLAFRVGGKLAARLVDTGAEIKAGQILARLDPNDLQLAAGAARAQLTAAESDYATTRAELERYKGLLEKRFISQTAFDAKENTFNGARAKLEQARSQSEISTNQANYGILSSEFPAIVAAVLVDAGQVVSPGQPVLRLARPEEKEVAIAVPENRLAELKSAKQLTVSLWADPSLSLRGELRELAPVADPATRTYAARIRLLAPPPEVRLGMTARVALNKENDTNLLIPLGAVIDLGKGAVVRVAKDGKIASRQVKVAHFREDGVALAEGLQAGELVVISGGGKLVEGQEVQAKLVIPPSRQR